MSPTSRSLNWLRREGFTAGVVERWLPYANVRSDLWGFADLLACHATEGILLVQTTSLSNLSSRVTKTRARPELAAWLRAGGRCELHGWFKRGRRWQLKRVAIQADDLQPTVIQPLRRRGRKARQPALFAGFAE